MCTLRQTCRRSCRSSAPYVRPGPPGPCAACSHKALPACARRGRQPHSPRYVNLSLIAPHKIKELEWLVDKVAQAQGSKLTQPPTLLAGHIVWLSGITLPALVNPSVAATTVGTSTTDADPPKRARTDADVAQVGLRRKRVGLRA
jgi:hypothetical protein